MSAVIFQPRNASMHFDAERPAWPYLLAVHAMLQGLALKLGLSLLQQVSVVVCNVLSQLLLSLCLLCLGLPVLLRMLLLTGCHLFMFISYQHTKYRDQYRQAKT